MTESIAAIAASGTSKSAATGSNTFAGMTETFAGSSGASASEGLKDAFRSTLETFQNTGARFEATDKAGASVDPVARARADLIGETPDASSSVIGPQKVAASEASAGADGSAMLRQSFDHALFVSLVSQIVSGASQATSTLIKQQ